MDWLIDKLPEGGIVVVTLWVLASLCFGVLTSSLVGVVRNGGRGWRGCLGILVIFICLVGASWFADYTRRYAKLEDVRTASTMLDGAWVLDGQPCTFAQHFEVRENRTLVVVPPSGFPFIYDITLIKDGAARVHEPRTGEVAKFWREDLRLEKETINGTRREYRRCGP